MSPVLGDNSPKELRESYCDSHFKPGAVLRLFVPHTTPKKIKRLVIVGINEALSSVAILFINSNPLPKPHFQNLQISLSSNQRSYLDHDSYLDCSNLYEWSLPTMRQKLVAKPHRFLGALSKADLSQARQKILSAKTISKKLKKRYGFV